jgi:hypothetical protein
MSIEIRGLIGGREINGKKNREIRSNFAPISR